ncbi:MAG TPA: response regulator [Vicinamibacteria bacterium]
MTKPPPPKRILVVDDDPNVLQILVRALPPPDFEVHAFPDAKDALVKMHDVQPDLILCDVVMPGMDGRTFLKLVRRSLELGDVPFLFLSGISEETEIVGALDGGADDFVGKPFPVPRLVAKVRALLRLVERRKDALMGPVGEAGVLPLLKFCEDSRLSGRLLVSAPGQERWAEFLGGELVQAGGTPEEPDADPFDALLAVEGGVYRIEQRRLDPRAIRQAEARHREGPAAEAPEAAEPSAPVALPGGRVSRVDVRGREIVVQTEGENKPHFTVTTVVARGGQVLRRIESAWQHALQRREDQELARAQIDRQHERVVATLRELELPAAPAPAGAGPGVDASLLAWALSFVAEQARDHLGAVMEGALLRRSLRETAPQHPALRAFRVAEDGRVLVGDAAAASGPEAVAAVAAWTAAFLESAAALVDRIRALRVRSVTRMMEADLERCGYYARLTGWA